MSALVDFARSLPERLRRPESLLMIMALLASIGAHMPPYIGLGALAEYFDHVDASEAAKRKQAPVEISFEVAENTPPTPEEPTDTPPEDLERLEDKPKPEPESKPEPEKPAPPEPQVVAKPESEPVKIELKKEQLPEPPPPPPQQERKQSITQKSEDPTKEPPPDAKYLAEENRVVEEETVASVTSETRDDPEPQAAAPLSANAPEKSGEDLEKDERGAEEGEETEEPAQVASTQKAPTPTPPPTPAQAARQEVTGREAAKEQEEEATIVRDPLGTFVLSKPKDPKAAQEGKEGQRGKAAATGQNLRVSWRTFEDTFGAQQLAQDRLPKEAKRRGAGREKRWEEFRAAIENYIVGVKPGNQTAMNALADPFAAYLAAFHRNLHMEFAHDFLESLPALGELGNPDLVTKVEIVVNPDGTLDRVGVVKSSGNLMYDFGAFNAVQRGGPYPAPPEKIRSTDGRVYMRWALHRNESQCGTWNAEPFILKDPPRSPNDAKPDGVSPYDDGRDRRKVPPGSAPRAGETMGKLERYSAPKAYTTADARKLPPSAM